MHNFYSHYKDEGEDDKRERERKEEKKIKRSGMYHNPHLIYSFSNNVVGRKICKLT